MSSKRKLSAVSDENRKEKQPRAIGLPKLRQDLLNETFVRKLQNAWKNSNTEKDMNVEVLSEPFRMCIVRQFLSDAELCSVLKESFLEHSLQRKESDLFSFYQSEDLSTFHDPQVVQLLGFLQTECCTWVRSITGLALEGGVSATLSVYDHGDHLLCHDDKFEDRRVAFILYLNSDWRPHFGGDLQIFNTYENNLPKEVVRSVVPENNMLVFFEVADNSFHQVAEVLVDSELRVTVNGWFHSGSAESVVRPAVSYQSHPGPAQLAMPPTDKEEVDVAYFVNPQYLNRQSDFQSQFETHSEMLLPSFLNGDVYQRIAEELCQSDTSWSQLYLPDHRRYEVYNMKEAAGSHVSKMLHLLSCCSFYTLLEALTGLSLSSASCISASSSHSAGPRGHYEVQRWRSGCYSLAKDSDFQLPVGILELYLFLNCDQSCSDGEGSITYIAANEEDKLLTIEPVNNMAVLVYRDDGTAKFVKYITSKFTGSLHVVSCSYFE